MAGYGVYNHIALQAGFNIFLCKICHRHVQVCRYAYVFFRRNINHEALAAVTALRTIYLWGNGCIQTMHRFVHFCAVLCFQKQSELIVFRLFCCALFFYNIQLVGKFHRAKVVDSWEFEVDSWGALQLNNHTHIIVQIPAAGVPGAVIQVNPVFVIVFVVVNAVNLFFIK